MGNGRAGDGVVIVADGTDGMGSEAGGLSARSTLAPRRHRLTGATDPAPIPKEPAPEVIRNNLEIARRVSWVTRFN